MDTTRKPDTILVVDDDSQLRGLLREFLEMAHFAVLTAKNGEEGWQLMKHHNPRLVITDIVMPDHEGLSFITRLRKEGSFQPKIIAISGGFANSGHYLKTAEVFGADATIAKPFLPQQILDRVKDLLDDQESTGADSPPPAR